MEKELANWIFYEEENNYYCFECICKRMDEINANKEFSEYIDYDRGDECGFYQDYADEDHPVLCCKCGKPLYSNYDNEIF